MKTEPIGRGYRPVDAAPRAGARVSDRWPLTAEERHARDWREAERAAAGVDDDRREARIVWGAVAAVALVLGGLALGVSL